MASSPPLAAVHPTSLTGIAKSIFNQVRSAENLSFTLNHSALDLSLKKKSYTLQYLFREIKILRPPKMCLITALMQISHEFLLKRDFFIACTCLYFTLQITSFILQAYADHWQLFWQLKFSSASIANKVSINHSNMIYCLFSLQLSQHTINTKDVLALYCHCESQFTNVQQEGQTNALLCHFQSKNHGNHHV